jgi:hypothetical protein
MMACDLSEHELRMLYKIVYKRRWCNKHISQEDLMSGTPKGDRDQYRVAIKNLIRKGWFKAYKSQGRVDVCIPKTNKKKALDALKAHQDEYSFIANLGFVR